MNSCEYATTISALACGLSKCMTKDEIALLAAVLSQLASTLATIVIVNEANDKTEETPFVAPLF